MKYLIRYWLKDKIACAYKVAQVILTVLNIWVNAKVVLLLSDALADFKNVTDHIPVIVATFVFQTVAGIATSRLNDISRDHLFTKLNNLYAGKILDADYKMFTDISCSNIVTTAEQLWKIVSCGESLTDVVTMAVSILCTMYNMYLVGGVVIVPIVIIYAVSAVMFRYLFWQYGRLNKKLVGTRYSRNQEIDDCINGFAEVRSFCTQEHHRDSIAGMNCKLYDNQKKKSGINMIISGCFNIVDAIGTIVILLYVTKDISKGIMNVAQGYSMIMYLWRLIDPLSYIINIISKLSDDLSMMDQFVRIMEYENSQVNGYVELSRFDDSIELRDVSFAYGDSNEVLSNVTMTIDKGKKIGICGESGGGKSTLLKLLTKFYEPTSGTIFVNGIDARIINNNSLRSKMAIVHQDNHILNGSIYDNITYGNWDCSEHDVIQACKDANIYEFIQSLPNKFNTVVGPKGMKLSGGQKQRIAIARIFLKNPDIVLLDEATSDLDNECESIIQEALTKFSGKTIITIAHRLSTIKDSDMIYVIGNHTVQESGTHKQLMKKGGIYASMYSHY